MYFTELNRWQNYWICLTCDMSVVFSGYSDFFNQYNWPPWYNWNNVESGLKHRCPNPHQILYIFICFVLDSMYYYFLSIPKRDERYHLGFQYVNISEISSKWDYHYPTEFVIFTLCFLPNVIGFSDLYINDMCYLPNLIGLSDL